MFDIESCEILEFPIIGDPRGNLSFIEGERHIPFEIKRMYYLYDVPGGAARAGHAHKRLFQIIIAMSGSFDVVIDDGTKTRKFHLARSYYGLFLTPFIWRDIDNFSSGSVCAVLASEYYDEDEYLRNYDDFLIARGLAPKGSS